MRRDPVCGEPLQEEEIVASCDFEGRVHYFKHIKCKMLFERDPEAYLSKLESNESGLADPVEEMLAEQPRRGLIRTPWILATICLLGIATLLGVVLAWPEAPLPATAAEEPPARLETDSPPLSPDATPEATAESTPVVEVPVPAVPEVSPPSTAKRADDPKPPRRARPKTARGYYLQGDRQLRRGRAKAAIASLKKCIELDPGFAKAYGALGFAYARQNQPGLARETFRLYLERFPGAEDASTVRGLIKGYDETSE